MQLYYRYSYILVKSHLIKLQKRKVFDKFENRIVSYKFFDDKSWLEVYNKYNS
jgi:hypothetical protein